jgi:hypothetical protein
MRFRFVFALFFIFCVRIFPTEIPNEIKFLLENGLYEKCLAKAFPKEKNFFCNDTIVSEYATILFNKIVAKDKSKEYLPPLVIDKDENWLVIFMEDIQEKTVDERDGEIHILNIDKTSYAMIIRKKNGNLVSMTIF